MYQDDNNTQLNQSTPNAELEAFKNTYNSNDFDQLFDEEQSIKIGIVLSAKLNVREEPSTDAAIVCEVAKSTELIIDESGSTDDFYKICTAAGIEGFCMKKFVSV